MPVFLSYILQMVSCLFIFYLRIVNFAPAILPSSYANNFQKARSFSNLHSDWRRSGGQKILCRYSRPDRNRKAGPAKGQRGLWYQIGDVQLHIGAEAQIRNKSKRHPAFEILAAEEVRHYLQEKDVRIQEEIQLPGIYRFSSSIRLTTGSNCWNINLRPLNAAGSSLVFAPLEYSPYIEQKELINHDVFGCSPSMDSLYV